MDKRLVLSMLSTVCLTLSTAVSAQPAWSIVKDKSPTDNSPQISAGLVVGDAALHLALPGTKDGSRIFDPRHLSGRRIRYRPFSD